MQKLMRIFRKPPGRPEESDYFREDALVFTAGLAAFSAWIWIGQSVARQQISARYGLLLMAFIALAGWGIYRLHEVNYLGAVRLFLAAQVLIISLMVILSRNLIVGYIFLLTVAIKVI